MDDISRERRAGDGQAGASPESPVAGGGQRSVVDDLGEPVAVGERLRLRDLALAELRIERVAPNRLSGADPGPPPDDEADRTTDEHGSGPEGAGDDPAGDVSAAEIEADVGPAPEVEPIEEFDDEDALPAIETTGQLSRVLFGLLATTREPLSAVRLAEACDSTQKEVLAAIELLRIDLERQGHPVEVVELGGRFRLLSAPALHPFVRRLKGIRRSERLSPSALETLAVIAYRQPVIRAEVESIRGVKAGPMLRTLLDQKLIRIVGRADVPGRPLQYGTSQEFLDRFGLSSLKDLPSVREFKSL